MFAKENKILKLYKILLKKHGKRMNEQWKLWCRRPKTKREKEEVAIGAILTQRTNWQNVERAIKNLREHKVLSLKGILKLSEKDRAKLETLLRPTGFYKQKTERLIRFCRFVLENYGSLENFFKQDLARARTELLNLGGIGPETADSILLYAGEKPIFVIDEYTKRLAKKYRLTKNFSYHALQTLFQKNLPEDVGLFQDFHAMIVIEGQDLQGRRRNSKQK